MKFLSAVSVAISLGIGTYLYYKFGSSNMTIEDVYERIYFQTVGIFVYYIAITISE